MGVPDDGEDVLESISSGCSWAKWALDELFEAYQHTIAPKSQGSHTTFVRRRDQQATSCINKDARPVWSIV